MPVDTKCWKIILNMGSIKKNNLMPKKKKRKKNPSRRKKILKKRKASKIKFKKKVSKPQTDEIYL